jgi:hypothetical protein
MNFYFIIKQFPIMKSLLNTIALSCAFALVAQAQITLTSANAPVVGTAHRTRTVDTTAAKNLNIGQVGANRTWDFRNLALDPNEPVVLTTFASKVGAPQAASFPTATIISREGFTNDDGVTYFKINSAEWVQLGDADATQANVSQQPLTAFIYPFTFNSTFRDTITVENPDFGISINLIGTTTGDAWGSIQTSLGTFNALRVRRIFAGDFSIQGIPINVGLQLTEWWTSQYSAPVLSHERIIFKSDLLGIADTSYEATLLTAQTVSSDDIADNLVKNAYPNPTTDIATMDIDMPEAGQLTALIFATNGIALSTKSLGYLSAGKQQIQVPVNHLTNGAYQIIFYNETRKVGKQRIVVNH